MNRNRKRLLLFVLSIILPALFGLSTNLFTENARAQSALLWVDPASASAFPGTSTNVNLQLDDIANVYGAQVNISFDPTVVAVVDSNPVASGVQISPGSCPLPEFVASNTVDNGTGDIEYSATQLNPTAPCIGGVMATIEFQCLIGDAISPITITSSIISDPDGMPIVHSIENGAIECLSNVFSIEGNVSLQSWPDPSGTVITLRDSQGTVVGQPTVTGMDGNFSLIAPIGETYQVEATKDRYLRVEAVGLTGNVGDILDIGSATLPAGDVNGDNAINILDITILAGNFNESAPIDWGD